MIGINEGLGPQNLQGAGIAAGSATAFMIEVYSTPVLELTQTYDDFELIPAKPGFIPILLFPAAVRNCVVESAAGVQVSSCQYSAGNNAARNNFINETAIPNNADIAAAIAGGFPSVVTGPGVNANIPSTTGRAAGLTVFFRLTVPAVGTGGYTCRARMVCPVIWVPLGDA